MPFQNTSEENFNLLLSAFNHLQEAVVFLDSELKIIGKNKAAESYLAEKNLGVGILFFDLFPNLKNESLDTFLSDPSRTSLEQQSHWRFRFEKSSQGLLVFISNSFPKDESQPGCYATLFEKMPEGVVYQDATGKITECNQAAENMLGLSRDQMQGKTSIDPEWHAIHLDGTDFPGDSHPAMVSLRTGKPVLNEIMGVDHLTNVLNHPLRLINLHMSRFRIQDPNHGPASATIKRSIGG